MLTSWASRSEREEVARKRKKHRFDLREFWPWYERSWPTAGGGYGLPSATPPPRGLSEIGDERTLLPRRQRLVAQLVCVIAGAVLFVLVLWGIFVTK
jgi:hypothetical protein